MFAWYSCFYLNFTSLLLISSMDLLQNKFVNKWFRFVSLRISSPIVFFLFLAPFGRPRPLFYWLFLLSVSKYSSSEEFESSYFLRFLLPFGLPRPFWETEICELLQIREKIHEIWVTVRELFIIRVLTFEKYLKFCHKLSEILFNENHFARYLYAG